MQLHNYNTIASKTRTKAAKQDDQFKLSIQKYPVNVNVEFCNAH